VVDRLAQAVPPKVREVCETIAAAGHQAVIVGGCVRDVIMGREPGDWDVASSAHPEDVLKMFKRTIPQGLQHGTVKVVMGRGKENEVEVTTFRGEGAYTDARRPDTVTFGVPLVEDLARRDLTVNAIAYDIAKNEMIDPFGGTADIVAKRLRAVGTPVDRFTEDGLRVMRAVRFAAQLEFELDPDTEAGIPPALPSLSKVSRERVCDELRKILKAREPSRGLRPAVRSGIVANILPELAIDDVDAWLSRLDRADPSVRLAVMMLAVANAEEVLKNLKFSNDEIDLAVQMLRIAHERPSNAVDVRRALARVTKRREAIAVWRALGAEPADAQRVLDEKHPLSTKELVVKGSDLMAELQLKPGPALGQILERLVNFVIEDPARNTRETLLVQARALELEIGAR
jgi:tRNA nucleotidyltransferase (CCA-adding enzyme)